MQCAASGRRRAAGAHKREHLRLRRVRIGLKSLLMLRRVDLSHQRGVDCLALMRNSPVVNKRLKQGAVRHADGLERPDSIGIAGLLVPDAERIVVHRRGAHRDQHLLQKPHTPTMRRCTRGDQHERHEDTQGASCERRGHLQGWQNS